jgi:hypothetical protein
MIIAYLWVLMMESERSLGGDEWCVLKYLETHPNEFMDAMEIARHADRKSRFLEDPLWAYPALRGLWELGLLETEGGDRYRVKSRAVVTSAGSKRFIAPHLRAILEQSHRKLDLSRFV